MRIQHNIMAMGAYRNYTNNVNAMKKNLEKLSSGYKINRAGDDAAGLAISEKMRAQITGLDTAQKNAKDGISLVQTAEGALTEVHDMLNRMVPLATQSANGTYDSDTDRLQLQKELNQLRNEIDRIADGSNFNGIKLLDGSLEQTTTVADELGVGMKDASDAITHLADGVAADSPAVKTKFGLDLRQVSITNKGVPVSVVDGGATFTGTVADAGDGTQKTTVTYDFSNLTVESVAGTDATYKVTIGDQELELDLTAGAADLAAGDIAAAVNTALAGKTVTINGVEFDTFAVDSTTKVKLTAKTAADDTVDGKLTDGAATGPAFGIAAGKPAQEDMTVDFFLGDIDLTNVADDIKIAYNQSMTGAEWAEKFMESLPEDKTFTIDGVKFNVTNDKGYLTFEMAEDPTNVFDADLTAKIEIRASDNTTVVATAGGAGNTDGDAINDNGVIINQGEGIGVHMLQSAKSAEMRTMAQGKLDLTAINNGDGIKDGAALKIGNETYIFAVGNDSKYKDMANVVDLTHMKADDANLAKEAARRLSAVAKDNKMFDVSTDNVSGEVRLTERKDSGIDYNVNDLQGATVENLNDSSNAAWKDLIQVGTANLDAKPSVTTGGLVLQIGDTAEEFNQLRVSIEDCHVDSLGLDQISILDQTSAAAAVDAIKAAINKVSDVRGTLGATQNRLDHTINNLSVMTENIQDAESTIRDTDVAAEMMEYTKNNILIQSAQAMLAQANQVPQGVLQLLQ